MTRRAVIAAFCILPLFVAPLLGGQFAAPIGIFASAVLLWFTEAIPLAATGLLIPAAVSGFGLMSTQEAFGAFGNTILFLFMGSFFLAAAMRKHGLDKRLAYFVLTRRIGTANVRSLLFTFGCFGCFISMWISNTTACLMMVPIALSIISCLQPHFADKQHVIWVSHLTGTSTECRLAAYLSLY
ncbi:MAG: SLC13 family permease [Oligoflexales bacterium]